MKKIYKNTETTFCTFYNISQIKQFFIVTIVFQLYSQKSKFASKSPQSIYNNNPKINYFQERVTITSNSKL